MHTQGPQNLALHQIKLIPSRCNLLSYLHMLILWQNRGEHLSNNSTHANQTKVSREDNYSMTLLPVNDLVRLEHRGSWKYSSKVFSVREPSQNWDTVQEHTNCPEDFHTKLLKLVWITLQLMWSESSLWTGASGFEMHKMQCWKKKSVEGSP